MASIEGTMRVGDDGHVEGEESFLFGFDTPIVDLSVFVGGAGTPSCLADADTNIDTAFDEQRPSLRLLPGVQHRGQQCLQRVRSVASHKRGPSPRTDAQRPSL
ncbi:hypothetical protein NL676_012933 [Syzygium grande]|nr:hypothetical protein NL676_012933 [Syzygium grande]